MKSAIRTLGLVLGVACLLAPDASSQYSSKKVAGMLKKGANGVLKDFKSDLGDARKTFCDELDNIEDAIKDELVDSTDVAADMIDALSSWQLNVSDAAATAADGFALQAFSALAVLNSGEAPTADFFPGGCGTTDQTFEKMVKELEKESSKILKKAKKFAKNRLKKDNTGTYILISEPDPPPVDPDPVPFVAPFKPLKADSMIGSNLTETGNDGKLCVSGSYDPRNGASVNVTIEVGGMDYTRDATVNPTTCRWTVCFGAGFGKEGPLPPGDYSFEVDQLAGDEAFTAAQELQGSVPTP